MTNLVDRSVGTCVLNPKVLSTAQNVHCSDWCLVIDLVGQPHTERLNFHLLGKGQPVRLHIDDHVVASRLAKQLENLAWKLATGKLDN
jgi:hypothetical protein